MDDGKNPTAVVNLLCGFAVHVDRQRVPLSLSAQRLIALLALHERPLTRDHIAVKLWPGSTTLKAHANLRSSLWRAQAACRLIDASVQQLALAPNVLVDVRIAECGAHRLLGGTSVCDDLLSTTMRSHLSADLLPDWYEDDWVLLERERFHQLRLHALEAMCWQLISAGRYGEAVEAGLAAVGAEPLRESAHEALIKAHLAAGNRWDAVRQFELCRQLLQSELGLEPSDSLRSLLPLPLPPANGNARVAARAP